MMRTENRLPKVHAAVDQLMHLPNDELYSMCYDAHKDFYGVKGRWMYGMSNVEMLDWFLVHFRYDEIRDCWVNTEPFQDEALPGQLLYDTEMEDRLYEMGFEGADQ